MIYAEKILRHRYFEGSSAFLEFVAISASTCLVLPCSVSAAWYRVGPVPYSILARSAVLRESSEDNCGRWQVHCKMR
jgi:hypothetical protein